MNPDLIEADGLRGFCNPTAAPAAESYGPARSALLNAAGFATAEREIIEWPSYAPTPLLSLPALAQSLGVEKLLYKDEGQRFGLKSFKALGGAYAVYRLLAQAIARQTGGAPVAAADIVAGKWRDEVFDLTVTCATDGNHGRSVAWGAQLFGCRCVIYIHATVSQGRADAIAAYGAEVIRVPGNYDDSVRHAEGQARANGWTVVSDTTYDGYRDIPIDVMHGYGVLAREIVDQMGAEPPTHELVQSGVGAFAASVGAAFWLAWDERRPRLIVVEPTAADCHLRSALAGRLVAVTGALNTIQAGLACGEVSPAAWEIIRGAASGFVAMDDRFVLEAVRALADPGGNDPAIVAGETGAAGLAAMIALRNQPRLRDLLQIDAASRVLVIGTEGDTDPEIYQRIVGRGADQVRSA